MLLIFVSVMSSYISTLRTSYFSIQCLSSEGVMVRVEGVMVRCQCQGGRRHGQGHGQGGAMSSRSMRDLRARGVVVSHPLNMQGALGSNPSESTLACYAVLWVVKMQSKRVRPVGEVGKKGHRVPDDVWEGQDAKWE